MKRHVLAFSICTLFASQVFGGATLEEILNGPKLGPQTPVRDESRFCIVKSAQPVGQTFPTGDNTESVFRIAVWQAFWHPSWQPDELLVMTLWDSPDKRIAYGRFAVPYTRRMWEGAVAMFTLDASVQPHHTYYFELTVETDPLRPSAVPREWVLSGKRPGFADGDGCLEGIGRARDDYPSGRAFVGGVPQDFDLWFQVHVRERSQPEEIYRSAFAHFNLDYPPLKPVKDAVHEGQWERAVEALVRHFESRDDLFYPELQEIRYDPDYDTRRADLACQHRVLLSDGYTVDLGPHWNHFALWPELGGVGLTRDGLRKHLAAAYIRTGNPKYARAFNDLLYEFFLHCPSPLCAGVFRSDEEIPASLPAGLAGGSMWSGLSIAARMAHGFAYYQRFVHSPHFTRDVRAAFIINLAEMADVLSQMRGRGNWETQMSESMFEFGMTYPEFAKADQWARQGFQTVIQNALSTVYPDGALHEPTLNYHTLVMGRYASVIERAPARGLSVPQQMTDLTERMFEFVMYSSLPDGTLPLWGDANPTMRVEGVASGAELFDRNDFLFVGSRGDNGVPPDSTSKGFPNGGFYYMRNSWQPDSHYLGVRCGPFGGHGHQDALSIIASAHGTQLLIDPGVYIYGTPESHELSTTRSHSTVAVDELDAGSAEAHAWITSEQFDFFSGRNTGYRGLNNVLHHRRIWFLKPFDGHPALWLILDDVRGGGEHSAALRYRFAPLPVVQDTGLTVHTDSLEGNLLVRVLESGPVKMTISEEIAAAGWESLTRAPVARFEQQGELPMAFTSLLVPYKGRQPITCKGHLLPTDSDNEEARAVWVELDEQAVLMVTNDLASSRRQPAPLEVTLPDGRRIKAVCGSLVIRFAREQDCWRPQVLHGVRLRSVLLDDKELFSTDEIRESLSIAIR